MSTRRVQISSPGCATFSLGASRATRTLLHEIYGIATSLVVTDQNGDELEDACETLANDANVRELNVFDEEYLEMVDHAHDADCLHTVHSHDGLPHCQRECRFAQILQARGAYSMQKWLQLAEREHRPRHAWLYETPVDLRRWLTPELADALAARDGERIKALVAAVAERTKLYSLPLFNLDACNALIEEVIAFEDSGLPASRPNTMNKYGLILDQIGMRSALAELRNALVPLLQLFYAGERGIDKINDHHAFIVQYAAPASGAHVEGDVDLGFHYDASDFTLNVCLGREWTGSHLYFCGLLEKPETHDENLRVAHERGRALMHIGQHRHGAEPIEQGERFNLIFWFRANAHHHHHHHHHDHDHDHDH